MDTLVPLTLGSGHKHSGNLSTLPLAGGLVVGLSGVFGPSFLGSYSLLLQVGASYQLHPES